jgi:hypothetical protein
LLIATVTWLIKDMSPSFAWVYGTSFKAIFYTPVGAAAVVAETLRNRKPRALVKVAGLEIAA